MAPPLLVLALEFHRAPLHFQHLTDARRALPEAFGSWLSESNAALAPACVEATAAALGTTPEALRDVYRFLLRQMLLVPQADHYRVLGLSRSCSPKAIKQHHNLLVRLFHPDRSPDTDERTAAVTARLNTAYQVLRDQQARRRYDACLAPVGTRANGDLGDFFRPHAPLASARTPTCRASPVPPRARPVLFWSLGCAGTIMLVYALVREPGQPPLRLNPELAVASAQVGVPAKDGEVRRAGDRPQAQAGTEQLVRLGPDLLSQVDRVAAHAAPARPEAEQAGSVDGRSAAVESRLEDRAQTHAGSAHAPVAQAVPEGDKAPQSAPSATAATHRPSRTKARAATGTPDPPQQPGMVLPEGTGRRPRSEAGDHRTTAGLISRLEQSLANGDAAEMMGLFTADAAVNGGVGAAAIHRTYLELAGPAGRRRVSISGLRWRNGEHKRLRAVGTIRIGTGHAPGHDSGDLAGTVTIELVPWMGGYKITQLFHRLSRKQE